MSAPPLVRTMRAGRAAPGVLLALLILTAFLGPVVLGRGGDLDLARSLLPPLSTGLPLGADEQGRDVLAVSLSGLRISVLVAGGAIAIALSAGLLVGLAAGLAGGLTDGVLMRGVDVLSAFPALLLALLLDGVLRLLGGASSVVPDGLLVAGAIGVARLPPLARLARTATRAVQRRDFMAAARLAARQAGQTAWRRMAAHVLPNVIGPLVVLATLDLGLAVTDEATLSFLNVGLPATRPSLGTLLRLGQTDLLSGVWWPVVFPGLLLVILVVSASRCGEQLRAWLAGSP